MTCAYHAPCWVGFERGTWPTMCDDQQRPFCASWKSAERWIYDRQSTKHFPKRERTWARRKNTHQLINSQFLIGPITDRYCFFGILLLYMYNIKFWNKSPPLEFFFFRAVHSTERRVILLLIYRIWLLTSALKEEEEDPLWFLFIYLFYISSGQ